MNKLLGVMTVGLALTLAACGGDSDSSGTPTYNGSNGGGTVTPDSPQDTTCPAVGTTVTVPNNDSCTFSIPNFNSGAELTYTCVDGRVSQGGISAGGSLNFGGYSIRCSS